LLQWLTQNGRYSAPEPPTTAALPQNVPLSPLMRLVAPRVVEAALDGGCPHDVGEEEVTIIKDKKGADRSKTSLPERRSHTNDFFCW
jgi:hypothetical protein